MSNVSVSVSVTHACFLLIFDDNCETKKGSAL